MRVLSLYYLFSHNNYKYIYLKQFDLILHTFIILILKYERRNSEYLQIIKNICNIKILLLYFYPNVKKKYFVQDIIVSIRSFKNGI